VKRLQILIDEEVDDLLGQRARTEGVSKAELLRRFARDALRPLPPLTADPIFQMLGVDDFEPADIDAVVYG